MAAHAIPKQASKANPPQNGMVTYHQDQLITPTSFSTTKTIPNTDKTPIPELLELELLLIINPSYVVMPPVIGRLM